MSVIKEKPMQATMWTGPGREVCFHDCPKEFFDKIAEAFNIKPHKVLNGAIAFRMNVSGMEIKFFRDEPRADDYEE